MDAMKQRLMKELVQLGTGESEHSTRSLLDHLDGVCQLLEQWGNPPEVCIAGLFHSVYGTESYTIQSVGLERRAYIRGLIGERTEELVYLFCACDKSHFTDNFAKPGDYTVMDQFKDKEVAISNSTLEALAEISIANMLEQLPSVEHLIGRQKLEYLFAQWKPAKPFVSARAYQEFLDYFAARNIGNSVEVI
jgi:hypothetical protein